MTTLSYQQLVADHHIAHWHLEMWTAWAFCGLFNALTLEPAMSTSATLLEVGSEKATQSTLIHDWDNHRDQNWSRRNVAQVVSFKANPAVDIFNKPFEIVKLPYHAAKFYCPLKCCKEFCPCTLSTAKRNDIALCINCLHQSYCFEGSGFKWPGNYLKCMGTLINTHQKVLQLKISLQISFQVWNIILQR